jgi:hypothetical protein
MKNQNSNTKYNANRLMRDAYYALPVHQYIIVRDEIIKVTHWSIGTFYHRLKGGAEIKEIEKPIIAQVFHKYGIEVFKQTA